MKVHSHVPIPLQRVALAVPAVAVTVGALLLAGCSGPPSVSHAPPSLTFSPDSEPRPEWPGWATAGWARCHRPPLPLHLRPTRTAPAGPNAVGITDFAFGPATLTVPGRRDGDLDQSGRGTAHRGRQRRSFHSPGMDTDATYSYTFTKAGHLRLHLLDPPLHARHRGGDK